MTPVRAGMAAAWEFLRVVEDDALPGLTRAFLAALSGLSAIDVAAVTDALARHDTDAVLEAIPLAAFVTALQSLLPDLDAVSSAAHTVAAERLDAMLEASPPIGADVPAMRARLALRLDELSPAVLDSIRQHGAELVREVTEETRAAIREAVANAYVAGMPPRAAVKAIQDVVGLTQRQEAAVEAYRALLTDQGRDAAQIERMTTRYAKRLRKQRATTIARTEANRAMNDGQRATWADLTAHGLLDPALWEREWLTVLPAPGVCPICLPLDKARAPINGDYAEADAKGGPPAHPNCRCTEVLVGKDGMVSA